MIDLGLEPKVSSEREFLNGIFAGAHLGSPREKVWEWADRKVALDSLMASGGAHYDSRKTPWAREFQDAVRDPEVHEVVGMKCSQSGFTEGALNVVRYMPDHFPGNCAYIINSDKKAKRISKVRLSKSLRQVAKNQITGDPNDFSTYQIILKNMEISISGSGSDNPFREVWYRVAFLDEPEDHELHGDGTTYSLINSRFTTVEDYTLYVFGKPQHEGGIIHRRFCAGTQEIWMVPCPRCERRIELTLEGMKFDHCRDLLKDWDLDAVLNDTYFECPGCSGRIDEHEKAEMTEAGIWIPRAPADRMRLEKTYVPPEPGVRSFHISDFYSTFPGVTWGKLARKYIMAHFITPDVLEQDDFRANHQGLPIKKKEFNIADTAIQSLRGGIREEQDGRIVELGKKFGLCYEFGEYLNPLPIRPILISVTGDRQGDRIRYVVFAWKRDGQSWLIDYGTCDDESDFLQLRFRPYPWIAAAGAKPEIHHIFGGLIDCRHQRDNIYEACIEAQMKGFSLWPSRGSGLHSEFKGKSIREIQDYTKNGDPITVYEFWDFGIKTQFYIGKISKRENPRLWMPTPVPKEIVKECTSETLVTIQRGSREVQEFVHDKKRGPNDLGDCCKQQYPFWQLVAPELLK